MNLVALREQRSEGREAFDEGFARTREELAKILPGGGSGSGADGDDEAPVRPFLLN